MLIGPRGTGKTSIAERIPTILPDLTTEQALEVTALHSVAGVLPAGQRAGAPAAVVRPAPLGDRGERARRRHRPGAARAGQPRAPRRAVPRRVPALPRRRRRGDAAAARVGGGDDRPRGGVGHLPRPLAGRPGGQPVPVRQLPRPVGRQLRVHRGPALPLPPQAHAARSSTGSTSGWRCDRRVAGEGCPSARSRSPPPTCEPGWSRRRLRQARRYRDCSWLLNASCPGPVLVERWPLEPDGQRLVDKELSDGKLTRRGLTRVQRLAWTVADCSGVPRPGEREAEIALALRSDDCRALAAGERGSSGVMSAVTRAVSAARRGAGGSGARGRAPRPGGPELCGGAR